MIIKNVFASALLLAGLSAVAQAQTVAEMATQIEPEVIQWRHHFHQYPELSNREFNTAKYVAEQLKALGLEVHTGVGKTGVVAILDSGKPGPVIGLRADMDALPVKEDNNLPYRSHETSEYNGKTVPVMHACGHDTHMAMLLGAAKVLLAQKDQLRGKVKFIFQPAEEGAPTGEEGGAQLMVKEGVLKNPDVDVIFGLHISSNADVGSITYRPGGTMAAVDSFKILIKGRQAHGASPWASVDPIVTAAQMVMAMQTIVSRELTLIDDGAVVTVGSIHGGNRSNIIPGDVELEGTIRTLNNQARELVHEAMKRKVNAIAASMRATAELTLPANESYPVTYNQPELMQQMLPTLQRTAGTDHVTEIKAITAAEDFSFYQQQIPGLYLFVGGKPLDVPADKAPPHHTPDFYVDDSGMKVGVELLSNLTMDYMQQAK
ncbi:amidohydrolase [Shewanella avicenniae]|uniref:Amidohydrolase n=1 Tax=Shewanella avicenniae TaxID=2814294 RepID=A0ABX7QNA4_9GAMM|nr:amidohydrolase [Shewanella avicenniae]QSX32939.1 amidohydrolase [Shewanella avicenniae]